MPQTKKHELEEELGLEYDIKLSDKSLDDDTYIRTVEHLRVDLAKEILEWFGEDLSETENEIKYKSSFDQLNDAADLLQDNKDDLIAGILRFANYQGLSGSGDGQWTRAVIEMAAWYVSNIHEYNQGKTSFCSLVNRDVRWDCSGFTTACLWNYKALLEFKSAPRSGMFTNDKKVAEAMERAGFVKYVFTWDSVEPFDIITYDGHVEIYNKRENGKHTSYAWGSCHDANRGGLPCGTAHTKEGYDIIWRNKKNGKVGNINMMDNIYGSSEDFSNYSGGVISLDELMKIFPGANRQIAGATLAAIDRYAAKIGLTEKGKLFMLAQMAHESANFKTMEEYGNGHRYEGRTDLGNTQQGDGPRFKGRGALQVTGRSNYTMLRDKIFPQLGLNYDIVSNPELLSNNHDLGAAASIGWLMMGTNGKLAVRAANNGDVRALTKAINGGFNGLDDRISKTQKILAAASKA